jgi:hypothetical protein
MLRPRKETIAAIPHHPMHQQQKMLVIYCAIMQDDVKYAQCVTSRQRMYQK